MKLAVRIGDPQSRGGLTLFPLFPDGGVDGGPGYVAGPDAFDAGVVSVSEKDEMAEVSELFVDNGGDLPLLLIEGETVLGAKQNRTLNSSVLVAAKGHSAIPVSCVEAGRWGMPTGTAASRHFSPTSVRAGKTRSVIQSARRDHSRQSNQGEVWGMIADLHHAHSVDSASDALEDVFEAHAPSLDEMTEGLEPVDGQVGVIVAVGGRAVSLDLFDHPATIAAYWPQLVQGYALDALQAPDNTTVAEEAEQFLADIEAADTDRQPGAGLGTDILLEARTVTGIGIDWDGALRHLAAFRIVERPVAGTSRPSFASLRSRRNLAARRRRRDG